MFARSKPIRSRIDCRVNATLVIYELIQIHASQHSTQMANDPSSDRAKSSQTSPDSNAKRKVQPLPEVTESQLLTPSQLNLPTLSVLETDLAGKLDNYRPKEIVHKDTPAREMVGSALPPKRTAEDGWEVAIGLLTGFPELSLREIRPVKSTEQKWQLEAIVNRTNEPVSLLIPRQIVNNLQASQWAKIKQRLDSIQSPQFPRIVYSGLLMGGFPLIATEKIEGPSLLDCHAGIHLPGVTVDWSSGHGRGILSFLTQVAEAISLLHIASARLANFDWNTIQIDIKDNQAKLVQWQIVPWLFRPSAADQNITQQQKDREMLGRLIYLMVYVHTWSISNWRATFDQPLAKIANDVQSHTSVPKQIGDIVTKCITAPKSHNYAETSQIVEDLKQFLAHEAPPSNRSNKPRWLGLFRK